MNYHPARPTFVMWLARASAAILALAPAAFAADNAPPVSYTRDILPFLEEQCIACHDDGFETSKLSVADVEAMLKGGRRGPSVVPGKGSESLLVQFMKGVKQPQMPPKTQIPLDQIDVIRRWIDEGAKVDDAGPLAVQREEARKAAAEAEAAAFASDAPPPVTGLAYSPDGSLLAVAGFREVLILHPPDFRLARRLGGFADQVTAVAFSPDGRRLAAAGGTPGKGGEVRVWEAATWAEPKVLRGHADSILALAWRPGSNQLATASLDKRILVWDADAGTVARTIKNHADIVCAVAYSPDGKKLASGSADKTAKVYDAETGLQTAGLTTHNDAVLQVAFSPDSQFLATAGNDRNIALWKLDNTQNPQRNFGHTGPVYGLSWCPDGKALFASSGGKPSVLSYKREDGNRIVQINEQTMPQDWVYAVAVAPDNQSVAAGGWDGTLTIWSLKDGAKRLALVPGRGS